MSKFIAAVIAAAFFAVTVTPVAFAADKADEKKMEKKGEQKKKGEGKKKSEGKKKAEEKK